MLFALLFFLLFSTFSSSSFLSLFFLPLCPSLFFSFFLTFFLSFYLSFFLSFFFSFFLFYLSLFFSFFLSFYLSFFSIYLPFFLLFFKSFFLLSISLSFFLYIHIYIRTSTDLSMCLFLCITRSLSLSLSLPLSRSFTVFHTHFLSKVNDPSPVCREAAADVIAALARRVSTDIVSTFIRYAMKWLGSSGEGVGTNTQARALVRTGSQVAGLMVATRPDIFKKLGFVMQTVASVRSVLVTLLGVMDNGEDRDKKRGSLEKREISKCEEGQGDGGGAESWAVSYHLLVLLER